MVLWVSLSFLFRPFQTFSGSAAGRKPLLRPSPRHQQMRHLSALFGTFSLVSAFAGLVRVTVSQWAILSLAGKHRGIEAWIGLNQVYEILCLYSRSIYSLRLDLRYLRTLLNCIILHHALYIAYLMLSSLLIRFILLDPISIDIVERRAVGLGILLANAAQPAGATGPVVEAISREGKFIQMWYSAWNAAAVISRWQFWQRFYYIYILLRGWVGWWVDAFCIILRTFCAACGILQYLAVYFFMFDLSLKICKHFNSPWHLLQNPFWQPSQRSDWTDCR